MADDADGDRLQALGMLASALAGRPVAVAPLRPGRAVVDRRADRLRRSLRTAHATNLESVAVHASLIAAGSLAPDVVGALVRHPKVAKRYLAVEGHRALVANGDVLPGVLTFAGRSRGGEPQRLARDRRCRSRRARTRSTIRRRGSVSSAPKKVWRPAVGPPSRWTTKRPVTFRAQESKEELEELDDGEVDDTDDPDLFTSPVGGGGFIGKWLKKMLSSARKTGSGGGGPPGADSPTHRTNSANRGAYAVSSTATASAEEAADVKHGRIQVPGVGRRPQELPAGLVHRARGRAADQGVGDPGHRRAPSACGARWPGSAWACIVVIGSPRVTTSTSTRPSRRASR